MAERFEVTTEKLLAYKEQWEQQLIKIGEDISLTEEKLNGFAGCFESDAGEVFKTGYGKQMNGMNRLIKEMQVHIKKLEQIAHIYSETERSNVLEGGTD